MGAGWEGGRCGGGGKGWQWWWWQVDPGPNPNGGGRVGRNASPPPKGKSGTKDGGRYGRHVCRCMWKMQVQNGMGKGCRHGMAGGGWVVARCNAAGGTVGKHKLCRYGASRG